MIKHETEIFTLILHGGNGRSSAMEAIFAAKAGKFAEAHAKIQEARDALNQAHQLQSALIQQDITSEPIEVSLLMVHAQDHLMNAITVKDLACEFVELYEKQQVDAK